MSAVVVGEKRKASCFIEFDEPEKRVKTNDGHEVSTKVADPEVDHKITRDLLDQFHTKFASNPLNLAMRNALTNESLNNVALNREIKIKISHLFSHTIDTRPRATDQKQSGRCWMFAALNCMRVATIREYDLSNSFEFSQNYLFFFDKLEKSNTFLSRMIDWADVPLDDSDMIDQLDNPIYDGGGWTMFCNLVKKYGVIPKTAMPESHHSKHSGLLNKILKYQLRQFTLILRDMAAKGATAKELNSRKNEMMAVIYRIIADNLGEPPTSFDWEYKTSSDKKLVRETGLTPLDFYENHIPYNLDDKVLIINFPHEKTPYFQRYASYLGNNTTEGQTDVHLNLPYEKIVPSLIESIKDNEPVYFSCDVMKDFNYDDGAMDMKLYDYGLVFDTPFSMTKAERILTRQSHSTHAMTICGVNLVHGKPNRWCVENSWGTDSKGGYLTMSHHWFENFTYKFAIDKKYLPYEVQILSDQTPIEMSATDPI